MLIKDMLLVLQAFNEGESIECESLTSGITWHKTIDPTWDFARFKYRVKPVEPRHIYISVCVNPDEIEKSSGFIGSAYTYQETKYNPEPAFQYIELTPEVRAMLTEKGIFKC